MAKNPYIGLRVTISGEFVPEEWTRLHLVVANSAHQVGYVVMRQYLGSKSRGSSRKIFPKRSRVSIRYGEFPTAGLSTTFHGYITGHEIGEPKKDAIGRYTEVRYFLIGTSQPLQKKHSWSGRSWSQAAKAIAKRHKLKAVVHQTPKLGTPLTQTTSDFKFLVEGAKKTGFRFFVSDTALYFVNPKKMLNNKPSNTPMFSDGAIRNIVVEGAEEDADTLYESVGVGAGGREVRARTASSEDDSQDLAPQTTQQVDAVVTSLGEARQAVAARALSKTLWVTAKVDADGDVRVIPGRVVYLSSAQISPEQEGLWITEKVVHDIDIGRTQKLVAYTVEMEIARDTTGALDFSVRSGDTFSYLEEDGSQVERWEAAEAGEEADTEEAIEVAGVWQAVYYGDDNSQVEYW